MGLADKARQLDCLMTEKKSQEELVKSIGGQIEALKSEIISGMIDAELEKFVVDDYSFSVSVKTHYSIAAADREASFDALRELNLGGLIQEKLDDRQLDKVLREIADDNEGELPDDYYVLPLKEYEKADLSRTKITKKSRRKS